jgi:murein DD-endopeptidase MepM/ murein hydrolase activator NlpD
LHFPAASLRRTVYATIAALVMGGLVYKVKHDEHLLSAQAAPVTSANGVKVAQSVAAEAPAEKPEGPVVPPRPKITEYTVASGDTLEAIANRFGLKVQTLVWANGFESEDEILSIGQKLIVPGMDALVYKIEEGDNFWTVAEAFGSTYDEVVKANADLDPQAIPVGAYVLVPGGSPENVRHNMVASRDSGVRRPSPAATGKLAEWPAYGMITDGFGWRIHPVYGSRHYHDGIDINASIGTPVAAAADGEVIMAQYYGGYGYAVKIDHGDGVVTLYSHLSEFAVQVGQHVKAGQLIAYSGNSGTSTGPHLHFSVYVDGTPVNPLNWLP